MTTEETWMPEARQIAAQCWTDDETKHREMDPALAEAVAKRIAVWMETAAWAERNLDYYRGLLVRCGEALGPKARLCDDGSLSEGVLCAKVPELVEMLVASQEKANPEWSVVRPSTRGELAKRLQAGECCEVAGYVAEMTGIMLRGWLGVEDFTIVASHNPGWVIFKPDTKSD